jgi:hypothetical protein
MEKLRSRFKGLPAFLVKGFTFRLWLNVRNIIVPSISQRYPDTPANRVFAANAADHT